MTYGRPIIATLLAVVLAMPAAAQDTSQGTRTFTDPDGFVAKETPGGYEPANPDGKGAPRLTPTQAYPPPPPLASYPPCTAKRRDNCLQKQR